MRHCYGLWEPALRLCLVEHERAQLKEVLERSAIRALEHKPRDWRFLMAIAKCKNVVKGFILTLADCVPELTSVCDEKGY